MQYRELGKTGEKLSILGFGAMRLPVIGKDDSKIDEEKSIEMARYCIDNGVNYIDTAHPYHGGMSEPFVAKVIKDGYRDKVKIATKMPSWHVNEYSDLDRLLDEQLNNLEVDKIDFYLLHCMTKKYWKIYKDIDYKKFLIKAKEEGKIGYFGFSFHDNLSLFKEVIDDFEWDFCQIQLNYLDETYQAGVEGMKYAADKGIGVIIMEPLRGGMLSPENLPEDISAAWDKSDKKLSPVGWALNWLWSFDEVSIVLSGMSDISQVKENIEIADKYEKLSDKDIQIVNEVKSIYKDKIKVGCTSCNYCMPCPQGVYIPEIFWAYNHASIFDDKGKAYYWLRDFLPEHARPSNCIECGECEEKCPQNLSIMEHLKNAYELYEKESN